MAARQFLQSNFYRTMTAFQSECQLPNVRWVRALDPKQYDFVTSNMVESMNNCLKTARKLQIMALV